MIGTGSGCRKSSFENNWRILLATELGLPGASGFKREGGGGLLSESTAVVKSL